MRENENIVTLTFALNFLIVTPAGHGIAILGLLEFSWFPYVNSEYFTLSLFLPYEESLGAVCLFSSIGSLLLIISMLVKHERHNRRILVGGLIFLFISFFYLTQSLVFRDMLALISFITGLPFLISSFILIVKLRTQSEH